MDKNEHKTRYNELIDELIKLAHDLDPWYDPYKIRWYAVYVKDKNTDDNIFDILENDIVYYDDAHIIPSEAMRAILEIQEQMKKVNDWFDESIQDMKGA